MSLQHRLPDHVVPADPWILFCVECARKMRIMTASPAEKGRKSRVYRCACGHSERIDLALSSTVGTKNDDGELDNTDDKGSSQSASAVRA